MSALKSEIRNEIVLPARLVVRERADSDDSIISLDAPKQSRPVKNIWESDFQRQNAF